MDDQRRLTNCAHAVGDVIGVHQRRNGLGHALTGLLDQIRQPRLLVLWAVEKQLQQRKGLQAEQAAAGGAAMRLKLGLALNKTSDFKTEATKLGLKTDTLPTFVPAKAAANDERLRAIAYAVTSLKPGDVSDPVPIQSDNATLLLHLDTRAPADPAGLADFENRFRSSQDEQLRNIVSADWADWKSKQPGTHSPA